MKDKILIIKFKYEIDEEDLKKINSELRGNQGFNEIYDITLIPTSAYSKNGEIPHMSYRIKISILCDKEDSEELKSEISQRLELLGYELDENYFKE